MNKLILDYLKSQVTGVLALEMMDGSPHGATLHFANSEEPFVLYFETNRLYKKAEALLGQEKTRATFVVGVSEEGNKTFQTDGVVEVLEESDKKAFDSIYLGKFPKKREKAYDHDKILFKFTPTWWRFTDFTLPKDQRIITSE